MPSISRASLPFTVIIAPCLLLLAIPLLPFALVTTVFAIICLLLRAAFIYTELGAALIRQSLRSDQPGSLALADYKLRASPSAPATRALALVRHPLHSFSSSGSATPRLPSTPYGAASPPALPSAGSYINFGSIGGGSSGNGGGAHSTYAGSIYGSGTDAGGPTAGVGDRDYEGVGGWRDGEEDDSTDAQWTNLYRRLELPTSVVNNNNNSNSSAASINSSSGHSGLSGRRRSLTGGSIRLGVDRGLSALSLRGLRRSTNEPSPSTSVASPSAVVAAPNNYTDSGSLGSGSGSSTSRPRSSHSGNDTSFAAGAAPGRHLPTSSEDGLGGLTMKTRSMLDMAAAGTPASTMNVGRPRAAPVGDEGREGREGRKTGSTGNTVAAAAVAAPAATLGRGWMSP